MKNVCKIEIRGRQRKCRETTNERRDFKGSGGRVCSEEMAKSVALPFDSHCLFYLSKSVDAFLVPFFFSGDNYEGVVEKKTNKKKPKLLYLTNPLTVFCILHFCHNAFSAGSD